MINEYNEIKKLNQKLQQILHKSILACIEKGTTNFQWDDAIMGTKINL